MAKTPREGSCKVTERSFVVPETPPTSHSFQAQESLKKRFLRIRWVPWQIFAAEVPVSAGEVSSCASSTPKKAYPLLGTFTGKHSESPGP